ncbi:uncharacterized protein LOC110629169 [Manihot esculenta]|uniref:uncharacterized protein LOC110629169 n=1 Tax=Manihot esculenta TaxID=3983 RepID=UPI000B5D8BD8|nr:uncharacterized protein LOC110629169 [Manihot esculenta]
MRAEADQRNPDKYCQYHRTHGHDTNNCYQLISEIEMLIKRGHLRNFVKKPEGQSPQPNPTAQTPRRTGAGPVNDGSSGTINMIVGGTGGRMSRRGKKRGREGESSSAEVMQVVEHSPVTITFSPEDAQGVQMPHDDAFVIEAVIHNYRVKKILVDDGSKVFLTMLTGPARAWFNSLEAGSIRSFGDLANSFISRFIVGVPADRKTSYLETVKQRRDESLREYVARFNMEALQIPDLD